MKHTTSITVVALLLAMVTGSVYANTENTGMSGQYPQEITRAQASGHEKTGNITVTQHGFTMDNQNLKDEVAEKGGKYYVITGEQGNEDHKTIESDIYK